MDFLGKRFKFFGVGALILLTFIIIFQSNSRTIMDTYLKSEIEILYQKSNQQEDLRYLMTLVDRLHSEYYVSIDLLYPFDGEEYSDYFQRMFVVYRASASLDDRIFKWQIPIKANHFATTYLSYQTSIDSLGNELFTSMGLFYLSKEQDAHFINVVYKCVREDRYQQWKDMVIEYNNDFHAISINFNIPYEYLLAIGFQEMMTAKPNYVESIWTPARLIFEKKNFATVRNNNPLTAYLASGSHSVGANSIRVDVAYEQYMLYQLDHESYHPMTRSEFQVKIDTDPAFNTLVLALRIQTEQLIHGKDLAELDSKVYIANSYNGNPLTKYYGEKVLNYMNAFNGIDLNQFTMK